MRVNCCCVALACALSVMKTSSAEPPPNTVITIATTFAKPLDDSMQIRLQREMKDLLDDGVLSIQWRDLDAGPVRDAFAHLVVANFVGDCVPSFDDPRRHLAPVLGFTHVSDGRIIPFLEIDCDHVAALLGDGPTGPTRAQRIAFMSRALAHVLAHEVFHVLMESGGHSRFGLAKSHMTREDLVDASLVFEKGDLSRLRSKLLGPGVALSAEEPAAQHDCDRGDPKKGSER
jgi:hypothetical protein